MRQSTDSHKRKDKVFKALKQCFVHPECKAKTKRTLDLPKISFFKINNLHLRNCLTGQYIEADLVKCLVYLKRTSLIKRGEFTNNESCLFVHMVWFGNCANLVMP